MKSISVGLVFAATIAVLAHADTPADVCFIDVNLVPMDSGRILLHQTVVVHDHTIVSVGPVESTPVPPGSHRIAGKGNTWLMPGLADMHTHVSDENDLGLYVANGVTTILHMGGTEERLVGHIREDISSGVIVGPQVFFSLMVDGPNSSGVLQVGDANLARAAVRIAKSNGYDFIKAYNDLSPATFDALVEEGKVVELPLIGHGVRSVGLPAALFSGQTMVAHAEEFLYTAFAEERDSIKVASVVADVKRSGAFVTPTLSTYEAISRIWGRPAEVTAYLHKTIAKYMSPGVQLHWDQTSYMHRAAEDLSANFAFQKSFTLALQRAGVPLLAGTDSPEIPGMYPGYSLHTELKNLVASGLSTFEALSAATRIPGEFMRKSHPDLQPFGVIETGSRADLVMLKANPLETLAALDDLLGVMTAGRWYDRKNLNASLKKREKRYSHLERAY